MSLFNPYYAFAADFLFAAKGFNIHSKQAGSLNYIYTFWHLSTTAGRLEYHHYFIITHLFSYSYNFDLFKRLSMLLFYSFILVLVAAGTIKALPAQQNTFIIQIKPYTPLW
jgi:hypothetical protein